MTDPIRDDAGLLRVSLRANAAFSFASGLTALLAAAPLAELLGVAPPALLSALGAGLMGFGALLLWLAARPVIQRPLALGVVGADLAWVVGSAVLLATGIFTTTGSWVVAGLAEMVLLFAVLQYVGLRRMRPAAAV